MSPRPRKSRANLPPYIYLKKGRYVHVEHLGKGKLGKETVVAPGTASVAQLWAIHDALQGDQPNTLRWLCEKYQESMRFQKLKPRTKQDYEKCLRMVCNTELEDGRRFGDVGLRTVTKAVMARYRDKRAQVAWVRANRELATLSAVFSWAEEYDYHQGNPAKIKRLPESHRERYPEDWEYAVVFENAHPAYLRPAMEFAYLMRLRESEVVDLQLSDKTEDGVRARRLKGSREQIVEWSPRLRSAFEMAKTGIGSLYVLHDKRGQPIRAKTLCNAFSQLMGELVASGKLAERFTFHDLKAKGVTDFDGDIQDAAGHKSGRVAAIYNRKLQKVPSTR